MSQSILFLLFAACALAQSVPRSEYPQPQFQREQWLTLNGRWEFEFDDDDAGLGEDWAGGARKFTRSITAPYAFETRLSGIGDTSFHTRVWYRRAFSVPAGWQGKRVLLHFGAVDYRARVWVNGKMAGEHEGGHTPLGFEVTPLVKPGANTVTVRAEDPPTDRYIPRGKQYWEPKSRGIFYTRTNTVPSNRTTPSFDGVIRTGTWQAVWLEAAGASYLESGRGRRGNLNSKPWFASGKEELASTENAGVGHATVGRGADLVGCGAARAASWVSHTRRDFDVFAVKPWTSHLLDGRVVATWETQHRRGQVTRRVIRATLGIHNRLSSGLPIAISSAVGLVPQVVSVPNFVHHNLLDERMVIAGTCVDNGIALSTYRVIIERSLRPSHNGRSVGENGDLRLCEYSRITHAWHTGIVHPDGVHPERTGSEVVPDI